MRKFSSRRDLGLIFSLALLVRVLAASPQSQPNYMDASYYLVGGQRLAQGYGFSDPYVWNYLDRPQGLPHPSHLYWMPLPSILVAASQSIFGVNYRAAQLPFVLLSAVLPLLAYLVAQRVSGIRRHAWMAALLTIFSPFYLPYWGVPESFAPFAVFGALALYWACGKRSGNGWPPGHVLDWRICPVPMVHCCCCPCCSFRLGFVIPTDAEKYSSLTRSAQPSALSSLAILPLCCRGFCVI